MQWYTPQLIVLSTYISKLCDQARLTCGGYSQLAISVYAEEAADKEQRHNVKRQHQNG